MNIFHSVLRLFVLLTALHANMLLAKPASSKPFVIGNLIGQLGNQLFIIAATTSLALDHGAEALFPDLVGRVDPQYNVPLNRKLLFYHLNAAKPRGKVEFKYREPHFHYSPIPFHKNMQMQGYFQSEKYFKHNKQAILTLFEPHPEILAYLETKYTDIISASNTVSIHCRSYLKDDFSQAYYPTLPVAYFEKAIELFPEDSLFVVFSNDIEKYKREFAHINRNFRFIEGEMHIHDLYLMSLCKNNIISNSSFSWWGAYLNKNPAKIVLAPSLWFGQSMLNCNTKDLIPEDWHIVEF